MDTMTCTAWCVCWPRSMSPYGVTRPQWADSLWPNNAIWRHRSGSTMVQVMACWLMAQSYSGWVTPYGDIDLDQHWFRWWLVGWRHEAECWPIIDRVLWHSLKINFTSHQDINLWNEFEKYTWKVTSTSTIGVKAWWSHQMETFSALLAICAGNSPVRDEFPTQRPVTRSFDFFLFDLRPINGWVNTGEAGDLRRYRAHYDVTVIELKKPTKKCYFNQTPPKSFKAAWLYSATWHPMKLWFKISFL